MNNNVGVVVPHLGSSQIAYETIKLVNSVSDAVVFFEQLVSAYTPVKCATMCATEMAAFGGTLVTSNLNNTIMAHKMINRHKVKLIFYVWDLEWLRPNKQHYLHNVQAYHLPDILVVRNQEHVGPLANYCNRQPIVKDFQQVLSC